MTITALILGLAAVALWVIADKRRIRLAELWALYEEALRQHREMMGLTEDAARRLEFQDGRVGLHLAESVAMLEEIERLRVENGYLRSLYIRRREELAGSVVYRNVIEGRSKLATVNEVAP